MTDSGLSKNSRIEVEGIIKRDIETLSISIHEKISWFSNSINERMNRSDKLHDEKWKTTISFQESIENNISKLTKSVNNIKTASHVKQGIMTFIVTIPSAVLAIFVIIQSLK